MTTIRERFDAWLREAADTNATDVHLVPEQPARIRRGGLEPLGEALTEAEVTELARDLFGERRLARQAEAGCASITLPVDANKSARVTLASTRGRYSLAASMRRAHIPTLEELHAPDVFRELLGKSHGLIVAAGPHGSGKTTTLYALVEWLNRERPIHIVTIEDPIEFVLTPQQALVQQREVGLDVPDVASGIASALEQDLDALLVGGLADLESLSAALHAAETGHLVIVQLHANDAREAIERIVHAAPDPLRGAMRRGLSEVLQGVIAQRLVKKPVNGRAAVYEVLVPDDAMRVAIASGGSLTHLTGASSSVTSGQSLAQLRAAGVIDG